MKKSEAFGPKMLAAWEKAITEEGLRVNCGKGEDGRKKAAALRYRLYALRTVLLKEKHPNIQRYSRVSLTINTTNTGDYILHGRSADYELELILTEAGITIPDAPELPNLETTEELTNDK